MALFKPFRALRPVPEAAARVAAVPYDVVDTDEARALAADNPLSFLHVSRAEIDLPPGTDPYAPEVYARAAENFRHLIEAAPFVREAAPVLYAYRLRMGRHVQVGIAGLASLDEYERDVIKKHERTRPDKETDRMRHILALDAQTGPVFLIYRASPAIDALVEAVLRRAPLVDFEAPDGVEHTLWRIGPEEAASIGAAFARVDAFYIADGHHRAAAAARARAARGADEARRRGEGSDGLLAVAFPHTQVQILPYNRVVRDLAGRSVEEFLEAVARRVPLGPGDPQPRRRGELAMYVGGRWYRLVLDRTDERSAAPGRLDVVALEEEILGPVLGIRDVRTDPRIAFVGGVQGTATLERLVESGRAAVAFSLAPVSVDDLLAVADRGGLLPPKSTWFEPKLRDGLFVHLLGS
jgi:uncharacterized protein (DUF1015 family)